LVSAPVVCFLPFPCSRNPPNTQSTSNSVRALFRLPGLRCIFQFDAFPIVGPPIKLWPPRFPRLCPVGSFCLFTGWVFFSLLSHGLSAWFPHVVWTSLWFLLFVARDAHLRCGVALAPRRCGFVFFVLTCIPGSPPPFSELMFP